MKNLKPLTIFWGCTAWFVPDLVGYPETGFLMTWLIVYTASVMYPANSFYTLASPSSTQWESPIPPSFFTLWPVLALPNGRALSRQAIYTLASPSSTQWESPIPPSYFTLWPVLALPNGRALSCQAILHFGQS